MRQEKRPETSAGKLPAQYPCPKHPYEDRWGLDDLAADALFEEDEREREACPDCRSAWIKNHLWEEREALKLRWSWFGILVGLGAWLWLFAGYPLLGLAAGAVAPICFRWVRAVVRTLFWILLGLGVLVGAVKIVRWAWYL